MIISRKRYEHDMRAAAEKAALETREMFLREKERENERRLQQEVNDDFYRQLQAFKQEICTSMTDLERRVNRLDRADAVIPVNKGCCHAV